MSAPERDGQPEWLVELSTRSDAELAALPRSAQPTWYRINVAEPRERASWSPRKRAIVELFDSHSGVNLSHAEASALADAILSSDAAP